jgi:phage baseplate assembly protein W
MRPDFGCGIHEMVFETIDSTTMERIRSEVGSALRRNEARIEVMGVTIAEDATPQGMLLVEVEYQIRRTNQIGNLVFPFYFKEGGLA